MFVFYHIKYGRTAWVLKKLKMWCSDVQLAGGGEGLDPILLKKLQIVNTN